MISHIVNIAACVIAMLIMVGDVIGTISGRRVPGTVCAVAQLLRIGVLIYVIYIVIFRPGCGVLLGVVR